MPKAIHKQLFQLKLTQEEKKGYLNSCKLIENWRNLRRNAKTKDLQRDVGVLRETFDRALQKKNRHIELLMQVSEWLKFQKTKLFICLRYSTIHSNK